MHAANAVQHTTARARQEDESGSLTCKLTAAFALAKARLAGRLGIVQRHVEPLLRRLCEAQRICLRHSLGRRGGAAEGAR